MFTFLTSILNVKAEPKFMVDFTSKSPPKARQIYLEIYKPKPWPDGFILRLVLD